MLSVGLEFQAPLLNSFHIRRHLTQCREERSFPQSCSSHFFTPFQELFAGRLFPLFFKIKFFFIYTSNTYTTYTTSITLTFVLTIYLLIMLLITYTTYTCAALQYGTKTNDLTKYKATYNAILILLRTITNTTI